jgi:metal-responsive CopG/Arc/MetJ family transcriptional regulator
MSKKVFSVSLDREMCSLIEDKIEKKQLRSVSHACDLALQEMLIDKERMALRKIDPLVSEWIDGMVLYGKNVRPGCDENSEMARIQMENQWEVLSSSLVKKEYYVIKK